MSVTFLQIASRLQQIGFIPGSPDWFYSRVTGLVLLQDHRFGFIPGSWDWFYSRVTGLVLLQGHQTGFTPGSPDWFYSRITRLVLLQDHQIGFTPGSPDWFYSRITGLVLLQDHQIDFIPGSPDWFYSRIIGLVLFQDHQICFTPVPCSIQLTGNDRDFFSENLGCGAFWWKGVMTVNVPWWIVLFFTHHSDGLWEQELAEPLPVCPSLGFCQLQWLRPAFVAMDHIPSFCCVY